MAGQITGIDVQKKNKERANIFIDGEFAFGLTIVEAAHLRTGQYLSDENIAALQAADEQTRAYEFALDFLSCRPRSRAEVARRLREKEFAEPTIEYVLQRLFRAGLIDDMEFARYWIGNREQFKPRGKRALGYELRQKGIADSIIDDLLQDIDQVDSAYRAAAPQIRRWRLLEPLEFRRKLGSFLQRRGFTYDVIAEVWERVRVEGEEISSDNNDRED